MQPAKPAAGWCGRGVGGVWEGCGRGVGGFGGPSPGTFSKIYHHFRQSEAF